MLKTSDFQNKKWYGKKKRASDLRKNIALNPREECSVYRRTLFLLLLKRPASCNERTNFRMTKKETKQKEKREFPNSVMKGVQSLPPE
ncbi:hypothetical protein TNCV_2902131 [Trichonephila clavipes]|nr:hypothetical protein TNCV_2902131 [Trichonephila clavipes]